MSRHGFNYGLGEDAGESTLMVTTTPSGEPTRQSGTPVDWGQMINAIVPTALSVYQQSQLTRMNVARINAGQQPLTAQEFSYYRVPSAEVQIGATAQTQKLMLYAALGLGGLVALRAAKII